jgi:hypothetical protein
MRWPKTRAFRRRSLLVVALLSMTCAMVAAAEEWKEQPYNPPPGSRWIVQAQSDEVKQSNGRHTNDSGQKSCRIDDRGKDCDRLWYFLHLS